MKPILFNTEMVRAILDDRKTVTRRVVNQKLLDKYCDYDQYCDAVMPRNSDISWTRSFEKEFFMNRAKVEVGDILYVRETFQLVPSEVDDGIAVVYKASENGKLWQDNSEDWTWRPSLHMPKEAARIFLKVTGVRVERLHVITAEDCADEGINIEGMDYGFEAVHEFSQLWNSTIKKADLDQYGWDANPFVFVIEFERWEKPESEGE